jgi:hypothetical protein
MFLYVINYKAPRQISMPCTRGEKKHYYALDERFGFAAQGTVL